MNGILHAFARNSVFANILVIAILAGGLIAARSMVREPFPEFSLDMVSVSVIWPGADPEEVEEGITRRIEEAIEGIEGIQQYNSVSSENLATVIVEVNEKYDVAVVKERIRNKVDAISNFPQDAEQPIIEEITLREEVLFLALTGDQLDEKQLKEWAENLKDEVRSLPKVSQVQVLGSRDYEISIELSEARMREYGITFAHVANAIRASSLDLGGGSLRTQGEEIRLRTLGRKYTGAELAAVEVLARPNGEIITLGRIADIRDDFVEDRIISRFNGSPAAIVAVLKTPDEDAVAIAEAVKAYVADKQPELPKGMRIQYWGDLTEILTARIRLLTENGLMGLILVYLLLWLFLDARLSFWVAMGMPICVAGALFIMWTIGATINMISLFGLIMVLGIVVDDAVVVGEAIFVARKRGLPPLRAAVEGTREVIISVFAAVTTTMVAFLPLMFVTGIMGKFISILPIVVLSCLLISLIESLISLPAHLNHLPDPNYKKISTNPLKRLADRFHAATNRALEYVIHHLYSPAMRPILRWRYPMLALTIALQLVAIGMLLGGFVPFEVFPKLDSDIITATLEFPSGTPIEVTEQGILELENALRRVADRTKTASGEPLLLNVYTLAGQTVSDQRPRRGNHLGSVHTELLKTERRGIFFEEIAAEWEKEFGHYPGVESLTFAGLSAGPPGAAIEIWVQGHDLDQIAAAADELKEKLMSYDGVYQAQHDFRPGKSELHFRLKPEAATLGLTVADLARQVYAGYFGEEAVRQQRGRDDVRVRVRYAANERRRVADLQHMRIRTPFGTEVPLHSVAEVEFGPGYTDIHRTDGMRRATVTAEVNSAKGNAQEIISELKTAYFPALERKYPGIRVSQQGEKKKMMDSIFGVVMPASLGLMGIYTVIALTFRSYIQPMVIMITVPFGLIGAVLGHMILGYELSMMSIFGMVALTGVVVNDAIVLIERVNQNLAEGIPFMESVRLAGVRRFRAIFLTTITTVGGLGPIILERDLQAKFLIPMAISLAAGVAFATLLTLIVVPCLLVVLNDLRRAAHWLITGHFPTQEAVEPGRLRNLDLDAEYAAGNGATIPVK